MSRCWKLLVLLGLLLVANARPAQAQDEPQVTLHPLACTLCETRVAPDGQTAAIFENRELAGGEVSAPRQVAITLIDTATGRTLGRLSGQSDYAADAAFSLDSRYLASLHPNGDLRLWDLSTRKPIWTRFVGSGMGRVAFTPDGETIVVNRAGLPQSFWLVDRQTGQVGPVLSWRFDTFSDVLNAVEEPGSSFTYMLSAWAIAPGGEQIAAATLADEVWLFDLPAPSDLSGGAPARIITNTAALGQLAIRPLGYAPGGDALYFADSRTHSPRLWSLETMTDTLPAAADSPDGAPPAFDLYGLALSPDGGTFAWVDQNEEAGERGLAQLVVAPVDDWSQPTAVIDLPANLRVSPPVRVFWTPGGRVIAGGFVNFEGENALVVVEP
jgi:WD40 repeat protein